MGVFDPEMHDLEGDVILSGRLEGKAAIVTGAAGGIGRAVAKLFSREGARVAILDIQEESGAATESEIKADGGVAMFIKTDVTRLQEIETAVSKTASAYGAIDILVNNAGTGKFFSLHEMDDEKDYDSVFDLNIKSYFRMCKLVIPHMLKNNGGAIVNTASVGGVTAMPGMSTYGASKAAVIEFTKSVAVEYATSNIRCNVILPGPTDTAMAAPQEFIDSMVPMKRMGRPEELAEAVLFFASEACAFCTGASLVIDGGLTCGPCF